MALLDAVALAVDPEDGTEAEAIVLNARYGGLEAREAIAVTVNELYAGRVALVSSFGAESAVLLHLLSEVDHGVPVIFLDTGRLFAETLEYRTRLVAHLGLTDVRSVTPDPERVLARDPHRALWMTDPDLCCRIRKAEPLARALTGFDAWFTGRKRFQSTTRALASRSTR
jgi:phosphoadenosine phosphosulfate reductase